MTDPANDPDKASPSDTPTERPDDNGGKSVVKSTDKKYKEEDADFGDVAKDREEREEPVNTVKIPPDEFSDPENNV